MERLRELRKKKKKTQQNLAEYLGITQQAYAAYENNKAQPPLDIMQKLANFFDVSIDYLLGRTDIRWTAEDYANGVMDEKKVSITADEEELIDVYRELGKVHGEAIQRTFLETGKALLDKK